MISWAAACKRPGVADLGQALFLDDGFRVFAGSYHFFQHFLSLIAADRAFFN